MSSAEKRQDISVEQYLAGEECATIRSEYVNGFVRAMSGATNRHNLISVNVLGLLWLHLRGRSCRPYNSDTKIRIRKEDTTWFYYPDVSVVCESNSASESFQDHPVLLVEVLSRSTRAIDLDEKLNAYLLIESLQMHVLLEQDRPFAIFLRRTSTGFLRETYEGIGATIELPMFACELRFKDIYADVGFPSPVVRETDADYQIESNHG